MLAVIKPEGTTNQSESSTLAKSTASTQHDSITVRMMIATASTLGDAGVLYLPRETDIPSPRMSAVIARARGLCSPLCLVLPYV